MDTKTIDSVTSSNLAPYENVRHAPPYQELIEKGREKRQVWDGVGVIALNQDPALIKSAYFGIERLEEPFVIAPPVVIYEAEANSTGVKRAHIFLSHNSAVVVNSYGINMVRGASKRRPTAEEIIEALYHVQRFGNVLYSRAAIEYEKFEFGQVTKVMPVQAMQEVDVPKKIEEMLMQFSK